MSRSGPCARRTGRTASSSSAQSLFSMQLTGAALLLMFAKQTEALVCDRERALGDRQFAMAQFADGHSVRQSDRAVASETNR